MMPKDEEIKVIDYGLDKASYSARWWSQLCFMVAKVREKETFETI